MTRIEWADRTVNPFLGCDPVSPGCANCYALNIARRLGTMGGPAGERYRGLVCRDNAGRLRWSGERRVFPGTLDLIRSWKTPQRIFIGSMSDVFFRAEDTDYGPLWDAFRASPHHTFLLLTKRPEAMRGVIRRLGALPNVWAGVTVENARTLRERVPVLRDTPAARRFLSFEPLLEDPGPLDLSGIDWAIVGGETGPRARPMLPDWVDRVFEACQVSGGAFFFKGWGAFHPETGQRLGKAKTGRLYRGQTWEELSRECAP